MIWSTISILGLISVVFVLANRMGFMKLVAAIRAQFGKIGEAAYKADPVAIHNQRLESAKTKITESKGGLAEAQATVIGNRREFNAANAECKRLENRIQTTINEGDPNGTLELYAEQLEKAETRRSKLKNSLDKNEAKLQEFQSKVGTAEDEINNAKERARELGNDLRISEQSASLTKLGASFDGDFVNTLKDGEREIQEKIDLHEAVQLVNSASSVEAAAIAKDDELERNQRRLEILSRFKPTNKVGDCTPNVVG